MSSTMPYARSSDSGARLVASIRPAAHEEAAPAETEHEDGDDERRGLDGGAEDVREFPDPDDLVDQPADPRKEEENEEHAGGRILERWSLGTGGWGLGARKNTVFFQPPVPSLQPLRDRYLKIQREADLEQSRISDRRRRQPGLFVSEYVWFAVTTVLRFSRLYMSRLTVVLVRDHRNTFPIRKSSWLSRSRYSVSGLTTDHCCVLSGLRRAGKQTSEVRVCREISIGRCEIRGQPGRLGATGSVAEGVRDARGAAERRRDLHIRFWNRVEDQPFEARHPRFLEVAELLGQLWLGPVCRDGGRVCGTPAQHFGQLRDDVAVVGRRFARCRSQPGTGDHSRGVR